MCLRDADQQEWSRGMHRAEDDGLRDADRPARPATRHRRPPRTSPQSLHTQSREKKGSRPRHHQQTPCPTASRTHPFVLTAAHS